MERFDAAVHNDDALPEIEKFNYLFSLLSDEALRCISGMDLTADNYCAARDKLKKRFGNSNRVIRAHVRELLNLQINGSYDKKSLRAFVDAVSSHTRSLTSLEVTSDKYSCILSPIILSRLPQKLKEEWTKHDVDEECTLDELIDFLERAAASMEYCSEFSNSKSDSQSTSKPVKSFCLKSRSIKCETVFTMQGAASCR